MDVRTICFVHENVPRYLAVKELRVQCISELIHKKNSVDFGEDFGQVLHSFPIFFSYTRNSRQSHYTKD
jgi:hypothetical protein